MADNVQTLIDEIRTVVDVSATEALTALNRRHKRMVARARSFRGPYSLGNTVAGQASYTLGRTIIEVYAVTVAGVPYSKARRPDIYAASQDAVVWEGDGGLIVEDTVAGDPAFTFIPVPTESGLAIIAYAAIEPADLQAADPATALKVDDDFYDALVEGAASTFLARIGEGDPDRLEARFEAACEEMRRRQRRRLRGAGPSQIRVQGVNA